MNLNDIPDSSGLTPGQIRHQQSQDVDTLIRQLIDGKFGANSRFLVIAPRGYVVWILKLMAHRMTKRDINHDVSFTARTISTWDGITFVFRSKQEALQQL